MKTQEFYRALEDRHRGDRALIKKRLFQYRDFLEPFIQSGIHPTPKALDLGCGRGEWLEVLAEIGFEARGVDTDEGMLAACHEQGLDVTLGDAGKCIREQPDDSLQIVSGFHLAEHISFELLLEIFQEAHRVLTAGGLLIMETPNPENIVVGTADFYVDPTHHKPLPPPLLEFVARYAGFERVKILRLQEREKMSDPDNLSLFEVFSGASPDYSVVAQKGGSDSLMYAFDSLFNRDFGLSLQDVTRRFEEQRMKILDARFQLVEEKLETFGELSTTLEEKAAAVATAQQLTEQLSATREEMAAAEHRLSQMAESTQSLNAKLMDYSSEIESLKAQRGSMEEDLARSLSKVESLRSELRKTQAFSATSVQQLRDQIAAIHASKSWKITKPLRKALDLALKVAPTLGNSRSSTAAPGILEESSRQSATKAQNPNATAAESMHLDPYGLSNDEIDRYIDRIYREIERRDRS